jgi:predicted GIY-YIG superfamily endonuclease
MNAYATAAEVVALHNTIEAEAEEDFEGYTAEVFTWDDLSHFYAGLPGVIIEPPKPQTLYRHWNADSELLYVGLTNNFKARTKDHQREKDWWREVAFVTVEHFDSREELERAEAVAIHTEDPKYNIVRPNPNPTNLIGSSQ